MRRVHEMTDTLPSGPGFPRLSAVCMRSLTAHPAHKGDPHDTLAAGVTDLASFDYAAHLRAKNAPSGDGFRRWAQRRPTADIFPAVPARGVGGVPSTVAG
jgi:hypothetical protein